MIYNSKEYEVTTYFEGRSLTQYYVLGPLSDLIEQVIKSHYLWDEAPLRKIVIRPEGEKWTKW